MSQWWMFPLAAGFAFALTGVIRRYALARNLLDVPNARSSHAVPTPRGGGMAIVLTFLSFLIILYVQGVVAARPLIGLLGSSAIVAIIGFLDDHSHIKARWRLLAHFLGAAWGIFWLGGLPYLMIFGFTLHLGWVGHLLAAFYLVWLLNLYNFMDGIDGIAAVEALLVTLGGVLLYLMNTEDFSDLKVSFLVAASVAGFLVWNFPKARIFMGDAGSGFLGLTLGLLSLQAALAKPELFWSWLILLAVFFADATVTLVRRISRGDRFYEAHRSHAYQILSRRYHSHVRVTLGVFLINLVWLLPLALIAARFPHLAILCVLCAYFPLVILAIRVGAGTTNR